ncbi:hypothetical protein C5E10_13650 [Pseudoclavibacter sp. RFBG4]|nr:hypothetical protein C5E10_13650 [Pseudoclavibacter sp. RFBG4]
MNLAEHNTTVPGLMRLSILRAAEAVDSDHPAHDYFRENYRRVRGGTVEAFERGGRAAHLTRDNPDPKRAAAHPMAIQDGLQIAWLTESADVDLAGTLDQNIQESLMVPPFSPQDHLARS